MEAIHYGIYDGYLELKDSKYLLLTNTSCEKVKQGLTELLKFHIEEANKLIHYSDSKDFLAYAEQALLTINNTTSLEDIKSNDLFFLEYIHIDN